MSEDRLNQLEAVTSENTQQIRGINAALSEITETMKAFASGLVEQQQQQTQFQQRLDQLAASQQSVIETQGIILNSVDRLANTVDNLAHTVDNLAHTVDKNATKTAQEMATLTAAIERLDRIIDYLMRRDGEHN